MKIKMFSRLLGVYVLEMTPSLIIEAWKKTVEQFWFCNDTWESVNQAKKTHTWAEYFFVEGVKTFRGIQKKNKIGGKGVFQAA